MESNKTSTGQTLKQTGMAGKSKEFQRISQEECMNIVQVIIRKIGILHRECLTEENKATHIRAPVSTIAGPSLMENRGDKGSMYPQTPDIFTDARGCTFQSVMFCDLDRLRDK